MLLLNHSLNAFLENLLPSIGSLIFILERYSPSYHWISCTSRFHKVCSLNKYRCCDATIGIAHTHANFLCSLTSRNCQLETIGSCLRVFVRFSHVRNNRAARGPCNAFWIKETWNRQPFIVNFVKLWRTSDAWCYDKTCWQFLATIVKTCTTISEAVDCPSIDDDLVRTVREQVRGNRRFSQCRRFPFVCPRRVTRRVAHFWSTDFRIEFRTKR